MPKLNTSVLILETFLTWQSAIHPIGWFDGMLQRVTATKRPINLTNLNEVKKLSP